MIDHITVYVTDITRSKEFYLKTLAPLGYKLSMDGEDFCGMGDDKGTDLWLVQKSNVMSQHFGFKAETKEQVHAFYDAALAAGATDNGAPGTREMYGPEYYGGFVHDPDGHNIEVSTKLKLK